MIRKFTSLGDLIAHWWNTSLTDKAPFVQWPHRSEIKSFCAAELNKSHFFAQNFQVKPLGFLLVPFAPVIPPFDNPSESGLAGQALPLTKHLALFPLNDVERV